MEADGTRGDGEALSLDNVLQPLSGVGDQRRQLAGHRLLLLLLLVRVVVEVVVGLLGRGGAAHLSQLLSVGVHQRSSGSQHELLVQCQEGVAAVGRGGVGGALGVLERRELLLAHALPDHKVAGEAEDVEDELLHLDAVGLLRLVQLAALQVHEGDLLLGDVVHQLLLVGADHALQEVQGEEVDAQVGGGVGEVAVGVAELCRLGGDLGILYHL